MGISLKDLLMLKAGGSGGGGKGLKYAAGSITITEQTNDPPTVTHNLGTKKIFALWWVENGSSYTGYNDIGLQTIINWWDIIPDGYNITVNKNNPSEFNIVFNKENQYPQFEIYASSDHFHPQNYNRAVSDFELTDNTVKLRGAYIKTWAPAIYHWIVVALDDALDDAGGL